MDRYRIEIEIEYWSEREQLTMILILAERVQINDSCSRIHALPYVQLNSIPMTQYGCIWFGSVIAIGKTQIYSSGVIQLLLKYWSGYYYYYFKDIG